MLARWGGVLFYFGICGLVAAHANNCAEELQNARGVWLSRTSFVPFYYDLDLAAWLTSLYARSQPVRPAVVLPLYSPDPLLLAEGDRIYISTAAILGFEGDQDLAAALASVPRPKQRKRAVIHPPCSLPASPVSAIAYVERRSRLEQQLATYRTWTERRLRIRAARQGEPGADSRPLPDRSKNQGPIAAVP